jgi:hypothetical protein
MGNWTGRAQIITTPRAHPNTDITASHTHTHTSNMASLNELKDGEYSAQTYEQRDFRVPRPRPNFKIALD